MLTCISQIPGAEGTEGDPADMSIVAVAAVEVEMEAAEARNEDLAESSIICKNYMSGNRMYYYSSALVLRPQAVHSNSYVAASA